jgi:hypothetical protein
MTAQSQIPKDVRDPVADALVRWSHIVGQFGSEVKVYSAS